MATMDMKALLERMIADPNTPAEQKKTAQEQLRALGSTAGGTAAPGPRELMEHYQRQIAGDPDYDPAKNPNSRNPKYKPYPQGEGKSMRRADDTEIDSLERRHGGPTGVKNKFPSVKKQRSTKKNPVPRGTVGDKTAEELDRLMEMMTKGLVPSR